MSDIQTRTMEEAFYLQTKAFLEKNSEHIAEIASLKADLEKSDGAVWTLVVENERLKAEVERLTKAGDAMLSEWASGDEKDSKNFLKALVIWNAAKEGEPTSNE